MGDLQKAIEAMQSIKNELPSDYPNMELIRRDCEDALAAINAAFRQAEHFERLWVQANDELEAEKKLTATLVDALEHLMRNPNVTGNITYEFKKRGLDAIAAARGIKTIK